LKNYCHMNSEQFETIVAKADQYMMMMDKHQQEEKWNAYAMIEKLRAKLAGEINKTIKEDAYLARKLEIMEAVGFRWRHRLNKGLGDDMVDIIRENRGDPDAIGRKAGEYLLEMEG